MRAYAKFTGSVHCWEHWPRSQGAALAADLIILTNQGATPGVKELAAAFSRTSGHKVTVIQAEDAELQRRLNSRHRRPHHRKSRPDR